MMNRFLRYSIGSDLVIYGVRCTIGFLVGYWLYLSFPQFELYWTLISIILVISPEEKDARRLTLERFKANLIGSSVGLVCFLLPAPEVFRMVFGIILSIVICHFFHLMGVARTAVVALIIVLIHEQLTTLTYWAAVERFLSVTLGCLIGLSVTTSTAYLTMRLRKGTALEEQIK
ncbi:aromatic acid exporter family protein [Pontibacter roseus]|uniref:aromatic acid exporter family protein n=1 Tax=Pontibacter roseus TaxID=336989 RepID=UPI0003A14E64|nr:aromatic acid exporter family protein [Pontibacter roseus]